MAKDSNPRALSELDVIGIKYRGATPAGPGHAALEAYAAEGIYDASGVPHRYSEPVVKDLSKADSPEHGMGLLGGEIARAVAEGRRAGRQILMTGGNCNHATGVVGGLQLAHGAGARIGLVWFDAHGDFNTPRTTLTGSLGGMPVAVCAGLAYPEWRESSGIIAPLPTDRILLSDMRNLDPAEKKLIAATDAVVAYMVPGNAGIDFATAIGGLSEKVDLIYFHIDADILDSSYVPHHGTVEPDGPNMKQVLAASGQVFATGKVVALALVSVFFGGEADPDVASGVELLSGLLRLWSTHGTVSG